jgi:N-acyl-L-homoserine lactone synthetase
LSRLSVFVCDNHSELDLLIAVHQLRYRVFKSRLDWEVAVSGDLEIDHYDIYNPTTLALIDGERRLIGCARILPTMGPNMLADTFAILLAGQPAPRDPAIGECSRFCIDTDLAAAMGDCGLRLATHTLVVGIAEWSLAQGLTELAAVTDLTIERILRRAGCRVTRLGPPMPIGKTAAVACSIEISEHGVREMRAAGGLGCEPVLVNVANTINQPVAPARGRA